MPEALVFHGAHDLRLESRPVPVPSPGEVVVRVLACGICGTDLRVYGGTHPEFPPGTARVPGHEIAAKVHLVGARVSGVTEGDYLFLAPNIGCGHCAACRVGRENRCLNFEAVGITRDGGFAEYMVVPERAVARGNMLPAPVEIEPWTLTVVEPLAAVLRGQKACRTSPGDFVAVYGAGPIGILHVLAAKVAGAKRVLVSEPNEMRRVQALAFGADVVVDPRSVDLKEEVLDCSDGLGADVVIVATRRLPCKRKRWESPPWVAASTSLAAFHPVVREFGWMLISSTIGSSYSPEPRVTPWKIVGKRWHSSHLRASMPARSSPHGSRYPPPPRRSPRRLGETSSKSLSSRQRSINSRREADRWSCPNHVVCISRAMGV